MPPKFTPLGELPTVRHETRIYTQITEKLAELSRKATAPQPVLAPISVAAKALLDGADVEFVESETYDAEARARLFRQITVLMSAREQQEARVDEARSAASLEYLESIGARDRHKQLIRDVLKAAEAFAAACAKEN